MFMCVSCFCVLCDLGVSAHVPLLHLLSLAECFCTTCRCAIRHGGEYILFCFPSPNPPPCDGLCEKKVTLVSTSTYTLTRCPSVPHLLFSPILWVFLILSTWHVFYVCKKAIGSDVSADEEEVRACRCVSCFLLVFFFILFRFISVLLAAKRFKGGHLSNWCVLSLSFFLCVC